MPKLVFLWSDGLIFSLVIVVAIWVVHSARSKHLANAWKTVFKRRVAVVSFIILCFYLIIALLDSLHFQMPLNDSAEESVVHYTPDVTSLLDKVLSPLGEHMEVTYSAPFAHESYVKESHIHPDGRVVMIKPRLHYAGSHLKEPTIDKNKDILMLLVKGLGLGTLLWVLMQVLLGILLHFFRTQKEPFLQTLLLLWRSYNGVSLATATITVGVLFIFWMALVQLSSGYHVLGTGKVGQDIFYEAVKSIRTGLIIGTLTTMIMLPIAIGLGLSAGYCGGLIDDVIQYIYTTLSSIPGVLLIAASILSLQIMATNHPEWALNFSEQADRRLLALCVILGTTGWTGLCRLLRAETLKIREMEYVQAAIAMGVRLQRILFRHILPNIMHIVLITVVLDFSGLVLAEAVLSYVGVGVDPGTLSWGNMINSARLELARDPIVWWPLGASFIFMFTLVLSANLFADKIRDAFDPRMRER